MILARSVPPDGGDTGIIMKMNRVPGDGEHPHPIASPLSHWAEVTFERFFIETRRRGHAWI